MHSPFAWPRCVLFGLCYPRKVLVNNNIPWCEEDGLFFEIKRAMSLCLQLF